MLLFVQSPLVMMQIGAIATGIFLLAVLFAVWRLRTGEVDVRFKRSGWLTAAFVVSSASIVALAAYTVLEAVVPGISGGRGWPFRDGGVDRGSGRAARP